MTDRLRVFLDDIEQRLDPEAENGILEGWKDWADHKIGSDVVPKGRKPSPSKLEWPHININDAILDDELMAIKEFGIREK